MSKFHVFVNCTSFERIIVEADTPEQAEEEALKHFECPGHGSEVDKQETRIATKDDLEWSTDYTEGYRQ